MDKIHIKTSTERFSHSLVMLIEWKRSYKRSTKLKMCSSFLYRSFLFFGFLIISVHCRSRGKNSLPNSTVIEYVNELCFHGKQIEIIFEDEFNTLQQCASNYTEDYPSQLAIFAYRTAFSLANRIDYGYGIEIVESSYIRKSLEELVQSVIIHSRNAEDFFTNETMNGIDWHGIIALSVTDLQQYLNVVVRKFYGQLNIIEVLNQFSVRKNSKNITKSVIIREVCLLAAIIETLNSKKSIENPIYYKVAFTLNELHKHNEKTWNDKVIRNYIGKIVEQIPNCLKVLIFSNMQRLVLFNEYYHYAFIRPNYFMDDWIIDKSIWQNVKTLDGLSTWNYTAHYDGIQIHGIVYEMPNLTDKNERFNFIASNSDPTICFIQPVISDDFVYMDYFNNLRKSQMGLWNEHFKWKIYTFSCYKNCCYRNCF